MSNSVNSSNASLKRHLTCPTIYNLELGWILILRPSLQNKNIFNPKSIISNDNIQDKYLYVNMINENRSLHILFYLWHYILLQENLFIQLKKVFYIGCIIVINICDIESATFYTG